MDKKTEIWKDIPNYEGYYQVSNLGRVKSLKRQKWNGKGYQTIKERIFKPVINRCGYLTVILSKNKSLKNYSIHQLVLMSFSNHNPKKSKLVVDHINNIKNDNRLENLQLISNRENSSKDKKGYSSKYVGVYFNKKAKKWKSSIFINSKRVNLGSFNKEYQAHLAYQKELKQIENGK